MKPSESLCGQARLQPATLWQAVVGKPPPLIKPRKTPSLYNLVWLVGKGGDLVWFGSQRIVGQNQTCNKMIQHIPPQHICFDQIHQSMAFLGHLVRTKLQKSLIY